MTSLRERVTDVTDEEYRLAVLIGLSSVPITVGVNWLLVSDTLPRSSEVSALVVACVVTGYIYQPRTASSARAGSITGFVGGIPVILWQSTVGFTDWWTHPTVVQALGESSLRAILALGVALLGGVGLSLLFWLVGTVGGRVGGWFKKYIGSPQRLGSTN